MKKRIFLISCIFMLCSAVFSQDHWSFDHLQWTEYSSFYAEISIEGTLVTNTDIEIATICMGDNTVRGVTKLKENGLTGEGYYAQLNAYGLKNEVVYFKLWDPESEKELSTHYYTVIDHNTHGNVANLIPIDFHRLYWDVDEEYSSNESMTGLCYVSINEEIQNRFNLELAVFADGVLRFTDRPRLNDENKYYFSIDLLGTTGENLTFKLYDWATGNVLETDFTDVFEDLGTVGENKDEYNTETLVINFIDNNYVAQIDDTKYETLAEAVEAATAGQTVVLLQDIDLPESLTVEADQTIILDLNGKKITYTSTTQGEAMITNRGNLTINDSGNTGEIYYNYTGAADDSYGKGNYTISNGGTLTVNGGKIHIANLRAHAKPIDNNSTSGDAILVINGGHLYNYNTSAIRQFCNSTTNKNSVTINGGLIEGYSAIWMQNPGSKTVNGQLAINAGEIRTTAKAYVEGTSPISGVASKIYCTTEGGTWDEESAFVITGGTINENVNLSNEAPASVTLMKEAAYNGNVEFELSDGAQLIHNGLEGVTINMNIEASSEGWGTLSSPTTEGKVVFSTTGTHDFYKYVESDSLEWRNLRDSIVDNSYTMDNGRGYLYANTAGTEVSFTGTLNYEDVEFPLSYTKVNDEPKDLAGFNFIGNPFTHNITAAHLSGNKAVGYYVVGEDGTFKVKNTTSEIIAPMQAILVQTDAAGKLTIQKAAPATQTREASNGALEIVVANANYSDVAYVSFNDGVGLEKIGHQNANAPLVYVTAENKKFAIATMSQDVNEIPVSFVAKTMGQYTISVEAVDCEFNEMYLTDRMTGEKVNLLLEDYTFVATSNDNADRFVISFATTKPESVAENFIYINNSNMIINNIEGNAVVRVLDVLGRPVAEYNVTESANISTATLSSGVYMIQMYDNNGVKVQKVVVE